MSNRAGIRAGLLESRTARYALYGLICLIVGLLGRHLLLTLATRPLDRPSPPRRRLNAPFITSPDPVVAKMVELARLTSDDLVYDLGCGDGRIAIRASLETGCRAVGFDIDPERVAEARENVQQHGVADRVQIIEQDLFTADLSQADAAMMYLLPWMMNKLLPQFEQMRPGCRIVSHEFWIDEIMPAEMAEVTNPDGRTTTIYLYVTPLERSPALEPGKPPTKGDLSARRLSGATAPD